MFNVASLNQQVNILMKLSQGISKKLKILFDIQSFMMHL